MKYISLLLLLILLSSCHFYNSAVPISVSKKSKINPDILGRWYVLENEEENGTLKKTEEYLSVLDFNNNEYAVLTVSDGVPMLFKMHSSVVKNKTFLNIFPIEESEKEVDRKYIFFVIDSLDSKKASLRYITDSIKIQFKTSKDFKKYLKKNFEKLTKEWLSEPFCYYRAKYFLWNKLNALKSADIDFVFDIESPYTETMDKTAAQLSIFPKKPSDKNRAIRILEKAYLSEMHPDDFQAVHTQLIQFNDGTLKVLFYSADYTNFKDKESGVLYKYEHK